MLVILTMLDILGILVILGMLGTNDHLSKVPPLRCRCSPYNHLTHILRSTSIIITITNIVVIITNIIANITTIIITIAKRANYYRLPVLQSQKKC